MAEARSLVVGIVEIEFRSREGKRKGLRRGGQLSPLKRVNEKKWDGYLLLEVSQ